MIIFVIQICVTLQINQLYAINMIKTIRITGKTLSEALRLAADLAEEKERLAAWSSISIMKLRTKMSATQKEAKRKGITHCKTNGFYQRIRQSGQQRQRARRMAEVNTQTG